MNPEDPVLNGARARTELTFDTSVYRLPAIKKAAYKFGVSCIVRIEVTGERAVSVELEQCEEEIDLQELARQFHSEVTDQELREVVAEETTAVRNLLLAQAFSATSLVDAQAEHADYERDPLGIAQPDRGGTNQVRPRNDRTQG